MEPLDPQVLLDPLEGKLAVGGAVRLAILNAPSVRSTPKNPNFSPCAFRSRAINSAWLLIDPDIGRCVPPPETVAGSAGVVYGHREDMSETSPLAPRGFQFRLGAASLTSSLSPRIEAAQLLFPQGQHGLVASFWRRRIPMTGGGSPVLGRTIARQSERRAMELLAEVAQRTEWVEIRCGQCDRVRRLRTARLLAEYGPDTAMRHVMQAQIGECPNRDAAQIQNRCDPYCLDLVRLFYWPEPG